MMRLEQECMTEPWNERMIESQLKQPAQMILAINDAGEIVPIQEPRGLKRKEAFGSPSSISSAENQNSSAEKEAESRNESPLLPSLKASEDAGEEISPKTTEEKQPGNIAGYIWIEDRSAAQDTDSELLETQWELLRIGVLPEHRKRGLARKLIQHAILNYGPGPDRILLEVAETNEPARKLYESCGFLEIHRRKNYYLDSDALIMERKERTNET